MKNKILGYLSALFFGCHFAGAQTNAPIPWDRIGAKAGAQYQGDGLSIVRSEGGAVLRCVFQKLEGHATAEGLWLTSTASDAPNDRFRVVPCGLGRAGRRQDALEEQVQTWTFDLERWMFALPTNLEVEPNRIRFMRPGLVEEYSVSMDGVRQDFVITQRPAGAGELRLELEVAGAQAEPSRPRRTIGPGSFRPKAGLQPLARRGCRRPLFKRPHRSGLSPSYGRAGRGRGRRSIQCALIRPSATTTGSASAPAFPGQMARALPR